MGKVNFRYYQGRPKPWRAQWTEKVNGKNKSRTHWYRNRNLSDERLTALGFELQNNPQHPQLWQAELAALPSVYHARRKHPGVLPERTALDFKKTHEAEDGMKALAMTEGERADWFRFRRECEALSLAPAAVLQLGLNAAASMVAKSEELGTAFDLWLVDAKARNLRPATRYNITNAVRGFMQGREKTPVDQFNGDHILQWVGAHYADQVSRDCVRTRLLTFFRWCGAKPRFWTKVAIFADVEFTQKVMTDKKRVGFYSAAEASALLHAAPAAIKPGLALGFFSGLRPMEMNRVLLSWEHEGEFYGFDEARGEWHIAAAWAKTRTYRKLYALPDCWHYWWISYKADLSCTPKRRGPAKHAGKLIPCNYRNFRNRMAETRERAGMRRAPKDGIRHSFGTHGFHRSDDGRSRGMEWTIALMGHTSGYRTFERRYNGKCSSAEGDAYFMIYPPGAACDIKTRARVIDATTRAAVDGAAGIVPFVLPRKLAASA